MSPKTMTRTIHTVLAAVVLAGVGFLTAAPTQAHAESESQRIRTYFKAIDGLTVAIDQWNADVTTGLSAAATKPEFLCSAEFAELVRRGHGMTNDFEGTGLSAPDAVAANHDGAAQGLRQQSEGLAAMTQQCQAGAYPAANAAAEVASGKAAYGKSVRLIRYYAANYR